MKLTFGATEIELEDKTCPMGCARQDQALFTSHDRLHDLPGHFQVVQCSGCGLMRTNPRPSPASMGAYYPDNYGPYLGTHIHSTSSNAAENSSPPAANNKTATCISRLKQWVASRFEFHSQTLPDAVPGQLLEIGCASGSFLHQMHLRGWQVQGIEFSTTAGQAAQKAGYAVYIGPLETAPEPGNSFDLIVGWMVLEHLHDPVACLKKLKQWAKPQATLVLSVPNAGSLEFAAFKGHWYALHLPAHLYHFTPRTLEALLKAGGWQLQRVFHQRLLGNLLASVGYVLQDCGLIRLGRALVSLPEGSGRMNFLLYPLAWVLAFFGQTGRMTVWAVPDTAQVK
jgi:2-polyprenyl-3-methyl-5-hydroxy-6-metoxy-1,4-benzoquinol methylase